MTTELEKADALLENIDEMPPLKMPIAVIGLSTMMTPDTQGDRASGLLDYLNQIIGATDGFTKQMFALSHFILQKDDPFAILGLEHPINPEDLTGLLVQGCLASQELISEGHVSQEEMIRYFNCLYDLGYNTMLPESENPEEESAVWYQLLAFKKMMTFIVDEDDNESGIGSVVEALLNETLDDAVKSIKGGMNPFIPFVITLDKEEKKTLHRCMGESYEDAIKMGPKIVNKKKEDLNAYAFAWDGYITMDDERSEAIFIEASQQGKPDGYRFVLRYSNKDDNFEEIGNVTLIERVENHLTD